MPLSEIAARKRSLWQGPANAARFAEQASPVNGPQRLRNAVEVDIIRRHLCGKTILDVGIGTGRVSLPLIADGREVTGLDVSPAMIERCRADMRAGALEIVEGELERLPFATGSFDTVISVDTFAHFPDWAENLDELLRVTRAGGRVIVDVGSRDHIVAVATARGCPVIDVRVGEGNGPEGFVLRLTAAELGAFAAERAATLVALIPFGVTMGSLVPNGWLTGSYAARSGGIDRLVSWTGASPQLFAFAEFIERRIVGWSAPAVSARMFAVFERSAQAVAYQAPSGAEFAARDERGPAAWRAEFAEHVREEQNRSFAIGLLLAARPFGLPATLRAELPDLLSYELARAERAARLDDTAQAAARMWQSAAPNITYHGVDLTDVFARPFGRALRDQLEANG